VDPILKSFKGWEQSLTDVHDYEALPDTAKRYLSFLEKYLNVPVTMVSTGPERSALILKNVGAEV
jgi:adenylosuccinate synthase